VPNLATVNRRVLSVLVVPVLAAVLTACGTRVDEVATPQSFVVVGADGQLTPGGTGASGSAGAGIGGATGAGSGGATGSGGAAGTGGSAVAGSTGAGAGAGATTGGSTGAGAAAPAEGAAAPGPASGDPIRLGAVGTRSGIIGAALENSWRGLFVWQEWVNANGGIQGRPVEVVAADDGADPGRHAAAVRRLISEEGVVAFVGNFAPLTFSAGVPLLEQAGIPAIGGDGGEAAWFSSPMAFPINGQTVSRARPAAKWALANLPERRAAVFYVNEAAAPRLIGENFADEWQRGGGEIALNAGVSLAQVDFTGEVIRARNAGADIVYLILEKSACNRFFDAARRQQYTPVWIAPACTRDNAVDHRDITAGRFYGVASARPVYRNSSPAEDEIWEAVARYDPDVPPDGAFLFAWLGGLLLEEALAQPGTEPTAAGIVDALHRLPATTLGGLTPTQSWPPGAHPEVGCGMISRFDGERFELLTPDFVC
jgi:branched-chain amino acid transport system substrate-binding protein